MENLDGAGLVVLLIVLLGAMVFLWDYIGLRHEVQIYRQLIKLDKKHIRDLFGVDLSQDFYLEDSVLRIYKKFRLFIHKIKRINKEIKEEQIVLEKK